MASLYNVGLGVLKLGLKIEVLEIPWHFLGLGGSRHMPVTWGNHWRLPDWESLCRGTAMKMKIEYAIHN